MDKYELQVVEEVIKDICDNNDLDKTASKVRDIILETLTLEELDTVYVIYLEEADSGDLKIIVNFRDNMKKKLEYDNANIISKLFSIKKDINTNNLTISSDTKGCLESIYSYNMLEEYEKNNENHIKSSIIYLNNKKTLEAIKNYKCK